ncbi:MAG: Eco57I restriction-modification methylase domain-containing protein [Verrucomicrobia bacterium]|nr:Eco57I restriction-modification methylase domain-containing protein [Verrucomicrobiota bacterium]
MPDLRKSIETNLQAFTTQPLRKTSLTLLDILGYRSDRTLILEGSKPQAFLDLAQSQSGGTKFDPEKALFSDWKSADILFQLTDDDLAATSSLFKETDVKAGLLRSYLFFSIELKGADYARGKLSAIARQINRVFPMPVMVLLKHGEKLSIAVINRRQNKVHADKDVLEKVTLIRDISLASPHRGHLDILQSFALSELEHPKKHPIRDFDTLHAAWEQIFNIELLNNRFYKELSNWYFWALPQVDFPDDLEKDDEKRRATGLIRLLTRLIFCWFLKEKDGLIPEKLFHPADLPKLLKGFDPESETSSTYYLAILQNLFFATLNQRMGKDGKGNPYRFFATDDGFQKNRATYDVNNLYRYENLFKVTQDEAIALFADIPFLNGGLFECLDRTEDVTNKKLYLDGFSRRKEKRPHVPDRLFFDSGETADLSEVYGDKKRKAEKVTGLISILNRYKFTIVENTPIDQEIALDPELLGKVFENLLASYNEETKTTARKQTGSFYTPRPIVDYMVDESLKAHLSRILVEKAAMKEDDAKACLDLLFTYTEKEHPFSDREVAALITAIDEVKILDPACGSGAFPMGVLHKLVYILGKLDPDNERWKQTQLAKLDSAPMREALEAAFADNNDDYGRKLYLIENCLYGVDIQPIAIQITKLRFFISLVCDQKTNRNKKENHGIRPLPNLETKFVAADTLIGLPISDKDLFIESLIAPIEKEIEDAYHSHFTIQRRDQKLALQKKIKVLRHKLADTLAGSLGAVNSKKAKHLAEWDPFDPQSSADFFDPHWMFGRSLKDGFDIVTGNPPYQSAIEHKKVRGEEYRDRIKLRYVTTSGTWDLYIPFFEAGLRFLKDHGILSFITPNKYLSSSYGIGLREYLPKASRIQSLTDVSHLPIFEAASVYPVISVIRKQKPSGAYDIRLCLPVTKASQFESEGYLELIQTSDSLTLLTENLWGFLLSPNLKVLKALLDHCTTLDAIARVCATTTAAEADELGRTLRPFPSKGWKTLNTGTIDPFSNQWDSQAIRHQKNSIIRPVLPDGPHLSKNRRELYSTPKILIAKMALRLEGFVDRSGEFAALNCNCVSAPEHGWTIDALALVLHSSVVAFAYKQYFDGLRMSGGYLPFQAPQLKTIPIPIVGGELIKNLDVLGRLRSAAASAAESQSISNFLADLSDACVMECYFRDHMADRDLLFHNLVAPHLADYDPAGTEAKQHDFLTHLHATLNAPSHPIRNRLLRLTADSPDLLAIIKQEGRV